MYEDDFESSLTQDQLGGSSENSVAGSSGSKRDGTGPEEPVSTPLGSAEEVVEGIAVDFADISALRESLKSDSVIKKSIVSTYSLV